MSRDVVEDAKRLGCIRAGLEETAGGRFVVTCSCGYRSTTRRTREDALGAIAHHLAKVVTAYRTAHGQRPPRRVAADVLDSAASGL